MTVLPFNSLPSSPRSATAAVILSAGRPKRVADPPAPQRGQQLHLTVEVGQRVWVVRGGQAILSSSSEIQGLGKLDHYR